ncbi:MAG TPA: hypothetical protein DCK83_13760 [Gallionellaceae bacterium]|nr:hypothetical protein [Gallionellaceae bacterium]
MQFCRTALQYTKMRRDIFSNAMVCTLITEGITMKPFLRLVATVFAVACFSTAQATPPAAQPATPAPSGHGAPEAPPVKVPDLPTPALPTPSMAAPVTPAPVAPPNVKAETAPAATTKPAPANKGTTASGSAALPVGAACMTNSVCSSGRCFVMAGGSAGVCK